MTHHKKNEPAHRHPADWLRVGIPLLLYAGFGVLAWKLGYFDAHGPGDIKMPGRDRGMLWFSTGFVLVYACVAAMALPLAPLAYGAGAVFRFGRASILIWIASMMGATAGYFLARGVLAPSARRLLGRHQEKLRRLAESNPTLTSLRMQLMPVVPFGVFNYAAALSRVPARPFLLGTALGIIPGTLAAALVGDRVIAGFHGGGKTPFVVAALVALGLVVLTFLPSLATRLIGDD